VSAEGIALIPECAECDARWLPADEERWLAHLGGDDLDEPAELVFYCPRALARADRRLCWALVRVHDGRLPAPLGRQVSSGVGGRYVPPLDDLIPPRRGKSKQFKAWWEEPVTKVEGALYSRRDYVLTVANKEGGGHVDPAVKQAWVDLTRNNAVGFQYFEESSAGLQTRDFEGKLGLASVRQVAWELTDTLEAQAPAV